MNVKIEFVTQLFGGVLFRPVSPKIRHIVEDSNKHNASCDLFLQFPSFHDYGKIFPKSCFEGMGDYRQFKRRGVFVMDLWTYRHLVGGQCD
jgi:hypothetical protein